MKKIVYVMILTLLLVSILTLAFNIQPVKASGTIYIRADGSIDPPTANITTSDKVTYTFTDNNYDSIVVERSNIVIDGNGYTLQGSGSSSGNGFYWTGINNVTVQNTNIKDFDYGVFLSYSPGNTIIGNNITNNRYGMRLYRFGNNITANNITNNEEGIYLSYSSNNVLRNNRMANDFFNFRISGSSPSDFINDVDTSNTIEGKPVYYWVNKQNMTIPLEAGFVALVNCVNVKVEGLTLTNNGQGLLLANTNNSRITNNNITNNRYGVYLTASSGNIIIGNNITNNNDEGIRIHFLSHSSSNNSISGNTITNNGMGIQVSNCVDNSISGNTITNNTYAILGVIVGNSTFIGNTITNNNGHGIFVGLESGNTFIGNTITNNNEFGVAIQGSFNTILENNITNNEDGIYLVSGPPNSFNNTVSGNNIANNTNGVHLDSAWAPVYNNTFYHNNFKNNSQQVKISGTSHHNSWDYGYPSGGNYWSDYTGTDSNGDGIGDIPYVIDANNQDNYPLMHPYGSVRNLDTDITYYTIQSVINAAETLNGHTIFVKNGIYYENVVVNKRISLVGENRSTTIVDGSGSGTVVLVDNTPNVNITGFTIRNGSPYGVWVWFPDSWAKGSITNNVITNCDMSIRIYPDFSNEKLYNYTIQNNDIAGSVGMTCMYNAVVADNNITQGVSLHDTFDSTFSNNTITGSHTGILCQTSDRNKFYGNTIVNNDVGCALRYADYNVFVSNFFDNLGSLVLESSDFNHFYHNSFINHGWPQLFPVNSFDNVFDNAYPSGGNYWIDYTGEDLYSGPYQNETGSDGIGDTPYVMDASNQDNYPIIDSVTNVDLAVVNVIQSKTVVDQSYCMSINVTIENQGDFAENFNVTVYANTTEITTFSNITLTSGNSITMTFHWTNVSIPKGNYTISAYAWPVPGEVDIEDNTLIDDWVFVTIPGDVDGDRDVDIYDVVQITGIYHSKRGDPQFKPNSDLDCDGEIKIFDVVKCTSHYGDKGP